MEAAIVSTLRGHEVTIFEKRKLGGALIEASIQDFKADIRRLNDYLCTRVKKLGIKVSLKEATLKALQGRVRCSGDSNRRQAGSGVMGEAYDVDELRSLGVRQNRARTSLW